ncbi:hypothetical protein NHX12_027390, partial [Muraenolepis orangiensis]
MDETNRSNDDLSGEGGALITTVFTVNAQVMEDFRVMDIPFHHSQQYLPSQQASANQHSPDITLQAPHIKLINRRGSGTLIGRGLADTEPVDSVLLQDWLSKFGYLPPADPVTGQLQTQEALTNAIKAMQKFGGLMETGVLDPATLGLMQTPRCSLPDLSESEGTTGRRRRSLKAQNKWTKRHLSWRAVLPLLVRTFPKESALLGRDTVRALMYYALKVWSDIAPLNFHEVAGSDADIQVDFTRADHDDGYPFDGPGGTVAHAFFPGERFTAGDTHFDDDEAWTFRSPALPATEVKDSWVVLDTHYITFTSKGH